MSFRDPVLFEQADKFFTTTNLNRIDRKLVTSGEGKEEQKEVLMNEGDDEKYLPLRAIDRIDHKLGGGVEKDFDFGEDILRHNHYFVVTQGALRKLIQQDRVNSAESKSSIPQNRNTQVHGHFLNYKYRSNQTEFVEWRNTDGQNHVGLVAKTSQGWVIFYSSDNYETVWPLEPNIEDEKHMALSSHKTATASRVDYHEHSVDSKESMILLHLVTMWALTDYGRQITTQFPANCTLWYALESGYRIDKPQMEGWSTDAKYVSTKHQRKVKAEQNLLNLLNMVFSKDLRDRYQMPEGWTATLNNPPRVIVTATYARSGSASNPLSFDQEMLSYYSPFMLFTSTQSRKLCFYHCVVLNNIIKSFFDHAYQRPKKQYTTFTQRIVAQSKELRRSLKKTYTNVKKEAWPKKWDSGATFEEIEFFAQHRAMEVYIYAGDREKPFKVFHPNETTDLELRIIQDMNHYWVFLKEEEVLELIRMGGDACSLVLELAVDKKQVLRMCGKTDIKVLFFQKFC
jgi:hypothetical protein